LRLSLVNTCVRSQRGGAFSNRARAHTHSLTMARTMGELLPESYTAVFTADALFRRGRKDTQPALTAATADGADGGADATTASTTPVRVFVDVGSGYGTVVRAAVESGGFDWGIGIEKYR
jgi:hypothetical protein